MRLEKFQIFFYEILIIFLKKFLKINFEEIQKMLKIYFRMKIIKIQNN